MAKSIAVSKQVKRSFTNTSRRNFIKTSKTRFYKQPATRFEFSKKEKFEKISKNHILSKKTQKIPKFFSFKILKKSKIYT